MGKHTHDERGTGSVEAEFEAAEGGVDEELLWDEDEDHGVRRRGWFRRKKAQAARQWRDWVTNSIPADDDVDEKLPVFLRGARGRIIIGLATMLLVFGWALAIMAIVA